LGPDPYFGAALDSPSSLKIVADAADWCVIEKPIGIEAGSLLKGKPPLLSPIYAIDRELGGIVLCAKNKQFYNGLRNAYGSDEVTLGFTVLAQNGVDFPMEIICNLPIARHFGGDRMIISHRTGKKVRTIFRKIETLKPFALWSAETNFLRKHQIRLHAQELGIKIFGEDIYDKIPVPFLSDFKPKAKPNRKGILMPLYPAVCIYLSEIKFSCGNGDIKVTSPLPDKFAAMLKIIQKWN
jgi:23S rRNA-/tRNA-specific pseudouridylate synthase